MLNRFLEKEQQPYRLLGLCIDFWEQRKNKQSEVISWRYHEVVTTKSPTQKSWAFVLEQNGIEVYAEQKSKIFVEVMTGGTT